MKINLKQVLKDYEDKSLKMIKAGKKDKDLTVRDALNSVINGVELGARGAPVPLTADLKGRIYHLSVKLWLAKKELQLSVESAAFIKDRAGKVANINPLVYGRICDLLEGKRGKENSNTKGKKG